MRKQNSTNNKTKKTAYEVAADRVATILADPETPPFLRDVLEDMVINLSHATDANLYHPKVLPILVEHGLRVAAQKRIHQVNGQLSCEEEGASHATN